jgi:hypothetical protein
MRLGLVAMLVVACVVSLVSFGACGKGGGHGSSPDDPMAALRIARDELCACKTLDCAHTAEEHVLAAVNDLPKVAPQDVPAAQMVLMRSAGTCDEKVRDANTDWAAEAGRLRDLACACKDVHCADETYQVGEMLRDKLAKQFGTVDQAPAGARDALAAAAACDTKWNRPRGTP